MDLRKRRDEFRAGKITKISKQKRKKDRASIFVDDVYTFSLSFDTVLELGLSKGTSVTASQIAEMVEKDELAYAKSRALHFVAHRPRTVYEVRRKLKMLGFDESVTTEVITYLMDYKYLDDKAFAFEFVSSRFRIKGLGPRRLQSELFAKGVDKSIISEAMSVLPTGDEILEKAIAALGRRWQRYARESESARKRKAISFLTRRGFSIQVSRQAFDTLVGQSSEEQ